MSIIAIAGWEPSNSSAFYSDLGWSFSFSLMGLTFPTGRFGGQCLRATETGAGANQGAVSLAISNARSKGGVAFAYRPTRVDNNVALLRAIESAVVHTDINPVASGSGYVLQARVGGSVVATGTAVLPFSLWTGIEFYTEIADAGGRIVVYINGSTTPDIDYTGDTRNGGTSGIINSWSLCPAAHNNNGGNLTYDIDDIVIYDDQGSVNNTHPIGDLRVENIVPNGAGNSTQWTPSAGSNFQNVDEIPPDGDTTYNQTITIGNKDTYTMGNLTGAGNILAVQPVLYSKKTDAGTKEIASVVRSSTNETDGPTVTLGVNYVATKNILETKPGGGAWSVSDVDAVEVGMKVIT